MNPHLTPFDVVVLAGIGGFAALLLFLALLLLGVGIYRALCELEDRLRRRRDLKTCRAINALGTTPGEPQ